MSRIAGIFPCFVWYCRLVGQICCMLAHIHRASFLRHRRQHHLFCYYGEHSSLNGVYHVCSCVWNFVQQHEVPTHMMALHHVPYHTHEHTLSGVVWLVSAACVCVRQTRAHCFKSRPAVAGVVMVVAVVLSTPSDWGAGGSERETGCWWFTLSAAHRDTCIA